MLSANVFDIELKLFGEQVLIANIVLTVTQALVSSDNVGERER